jgi:hypothetical protein
VYIDEVLLKHSHVHSFTYWLYVCVPKAELGSCNSEHVASRVESVYFLVLYRSLLTFSILTTETQKNYTPGYAALDFKLRAPGNGECWGGFSLKFPFLCYLPKRNTVLFNPLTEMSLAKED